MKTYYTERPEPLYKGTEFNGKISYIVAANAIELPDDGGWEADTHNFIEVTGVFNEQDAVEHPEKYLKYIPSWQFPEVEKEYTTAVQKHLDGETQLHGYDGILAVCSYSSSTVEKYKKEALACIEWRDNVWLQTNDYLNKLKNGEVEPVSIEELIAALPKMVWPNADSE